MERQLVLIPDGPDWHLDDATREAGRQGLAAARAALRDAARRSRSEHAAGRAA
jgi:hypothetical protein